jgi:hypothetical protein
VVFDVSVTVQVVVEAVVHPVHEANVFAPEVAGAVNVTVVPEL